MAKKPLYISPGTKRVCQTTKSRRFLYVYHGFRFNLSIKGNTFLFSPQRHKPLACGSFRFGKPQAPSPAIQQQTEPLGPACLSVLVFLAAFQLHTAHWRSWNGKLSGGRERGADGASASGWGLPPCPEGCPSSPEAVHCVSCLHTALFPGFGPVLLAGPVVWPWGHVVPPAVYRIS